MEKFNDSLGTQLNIIARSLRVALEKELSHLGISPSQWMLLMALHEKDGQGQTELGKMVNQDNATITRSLDKLQERELIIRVQDQGDRRAQIVSLTPKGRTACKEWNFIGQAVNHKASKGLTVTEKKKLLEMLALIGGNMNGNGD
jgi:DNA-binding MarR family transcriptional regulator